MTSGSKRLSRQGGIYGELIPIGRDEAIAIVSGRSSNWRSPFLMQRHIIAIGALFLPQLVA